MKKVLIILGIVIVVFFAAGIVVGNIFYKLALTPGSDKSAVLSAEHNVIPNSATDKSTEEAQKIYEASQKEQKEWLEENNFKDAHIQSRDNLRLHAIQVQNPANTGKWVIACHGYTGKAEQMVRVGRKFYDNEDYSLLLPDARGHGQSEGDYIGMGWDERLDIVDWVDFILENEPDAQIVIYGVSMGGATVMMVSGEELPSNVKVIVEDCGYSSIWGEFSYQLKALFKLPDFPVMHFSSLVTKARAGFWLGEGDTVKQVEKSVTPMLFIHGSEDTFVPSSMLDVVYDAANVPKEKLLVEGAGHGMAESVAGEKYWETVFGFVNRFVD